MPDSTLSDASRAGIDLTHATQLSADRAASRQYGFQPARLLPPQWQAPLFDDVDGQPGTGSGS
jgi:hypothetical protein